MKPSAPSGHGRVLPLRVAVLPGESLDSWLEALALRNGLRLHSLLRVLGLPIPQNTRNLVTGLPASALRNLESLAALPAHRLDLAVVHPTIPFGAKRARGSRYCPTCLSERGGRWKLSWWLPWVFACTPHRALLHDTCPGCPTLARRTLPVGFGPPNVCTCRTSANPRCGTDLRTARVVALPPDSPLLSTQRWIDDLTTVGDTARTAQIFSDLHMSTNWFLRCLTDRDATGLEDAIEAGWAARPDPSAAAPSDRFKKLSAAVTAVIAHHGQPMTADDPAEAIRYLRDLLRREPGATITPAGMAFPHWRRLSVALRARFLRAADPRLGHLDRVRLRSCTPQARLPVRGDDQAAARARHVPQLLWPDWTLRLMPRQGIQPELFRGTAAALLLLPGQPRRPARVALSHLHGHLPRYMTRTLQLLIRQGHHPVLSAFCHLADYLDEHGSRIDYHRRRAHIGDDLLTEQDWQQLCFTTGTHPGETGPHAAPIPRRRHAQHHLYQLLTGADLSDPAHALTWRNPSDRNRYFLFALTLTRAQRAAFRQYAHDHLQRLGIDEPVT